jgi:TPR repeat protein
MIGRLADIVTNPIIPTQIEKNESCGMELLKIAAENIPGYALSLMFSFLLGELVDQAIEKNEEYANMFQTYALKDPDCMWNIGILYICGTVGDGKHTLSLPQDEKKGLNFLHQAAESSREKIYKLACGYLAGLMFYLFSRPQWYLFWNIEAKCV